VFGVVAVLTLFLFKKLLLTFVADKKLPDIKLEAVLPVER